MLLKENLPGREAPSSPWPSWLFGITLAPEHDPDNPKVVPTFGNHAVASPAACALKSAYHGGAQRLRDRLALGRLYERQPH